MGWVVHSLGGISLLFTDPLTSTYMVEDMDEPPEEEIGDEYANLNNGAGARLSKFSVGKAPFGFSVICLGSDQGVADEARDALQDKITLAMGGTVVTYEYQEDATQPEPISWRVLGGRVRHRWHSGKGEQIFGIYGRYTALARVTLNLSKG